MKKQNKKAPKKEVEMDWSCEDSSASLLIATKCYEDGMVELYQEIQTSLSGMQILYYFVVCSNLEVKIKSANFSSVKEVEEVLLRNEKEINSFLKSMDSLLSSTSFL